MFAVHTSAIIGLRCIVMAWDGSEIDGPHAELAERWAAALGGGTRDHVVPLSAAEVRHLLTGLAADLLVAAATGGTARVAEVGAALAAAHFVGDEVLGRSVTVLSDWFAETGVPRTHSAELLGSFAAGYLRAFRAWLLAEQESVRRADIAARRLVEDRLRASEARLRAVFAQAGIGTGLSDMTGRIIEVNAAFARMLGYTPEQMCALAVTDLTHPDDPPDMWNRYGGLIGGEQDNVQLEKAYLHRDGHTVWTNINVSLIRDEHGAPQYTLILVEDISEQRALRERLNYRAHHDPLTGLANRSRFFDALHSAFADPRAESACATSTSTISRPSTTPSATPSATNCSCGPRTGCATACANPTGWWPAWAATNSSSWCPRPPAPRNWPPWPARCSPPSPNRSRSAATASP